MKWQMPATEHIVIRYLFCNLGYKDKYGMVPASDELRI